MKKIPLLLMGCGGVGRQLLHIVSCQPLHSKQGIRLRVVGVCDSNSLVLALDVSTKELDDASLMVVCRIKSSGSSLHSLSDCQVFSGQEVVKKAIDIADRFGKSTGMAFVDCSASSKTVEVLNQVADLGCCVVLANKKPLTASLEAYAKLVSHPCHIRHESTVGAGLPVIASLNHMISCGDPIHCIIGSLSGTLGYVMSELENGKPFSKVVNAAKSLGYTEPDPRDDLSGMDVARNMALTDYLSVPLKQRLILAQLLGHRLSLENIKIESLYPVEMAPNVMPVEDFLVNGLPLLNKDIQDRITKASSKGKVLRYVCLIENNRCEVGIQELEKDSPFGRLRGSDNLLEIYSRCYREQPLVIQGAGAGNDTTAAGVLADIQDLFP